MEAVDIKESLTVDNDIVRAADLPALLDRYPKIKVLSLDCFDTLLWRSTISPEDMFFDLQNRPAFKALGLSASMRMKAEHEARHALFFRYNTSEVRLRDIYLSYSPDLNEEQLSSLAEEEISEEMTTCNIFPPVIELMRAARAHGLKIIIVSDTYFEEQQLRRILSHVLPSDVMDMIMKIYVSCEHSKSKYQGLFKKVCAEINESPKSILHLGDNPKADYMAAKALGLNAVMLRHQADEITHMLRMQALAGSFIDTDIRHDRSLNSPFRGLLAATNADVTPEHLIGYVSAGQIMYAFGRFICDTVERLRRQDKSVKVLFLMRDGYLPSLVCEKLTGKEIGKRVRISRFAAYAASFNDQKTINRYLAKNVASQRFSDMCKQLLLPEKTARSISDKAMQSDNPEKTFTGLVNEKDILETIYRNSKAYRQRLMQHLKNEVNFEKGDTLVFVDLGYTGTAQIQLQPVFREEMDADIFGCYLLSLRTPGWQNNRCGLLDPSWCDDRSLDLLVSYIALLEQICTSNEQSVIDYDKDGNPIYSETSLSKQQHDKLADIQAECLRFVSDAENYFQASGRHVPLHILRDTAMAELGRMLFLPSQIELDYLGSFQFDLNLATRDVLKVFDHEKGLTGLRRRGLHFMEKNLKTMRTNYPAELRTAGLELVLTLMAQHRVSFDVRANEMSLLRKAVNVIYIRGGQASQGKQEAMPTYDGYFSLNVPIGTGDFQIGLQFGLDYKWVQLESAEIIPVKYLYGDKESEHTLDASACLAVDKMNDKGGGLFECEAETGMVVFLPACKLDEGRHVLRVVFRPIVERK